MASRENQRAKDQAMAAYMKQMGIKRNTAKCPICNKVVNVANLYTHIITCR